MNSATLTEVVMVLLVFHNIIYMILILEATIILLVVIAVAFIINAIEDKNRKTNLLHFGDVINRSGLPVVTFSNGGKKFMFLLDTGSNYSIIDSNSLNQVEHSVIEGATGEVYGMDGSIVKISYAHIVLKGDNSTFEDNFQVVNMSNAFANLKENQGVEVIGIIGSNFMNRYNFILDFKDLIAYTK